MASITKVPIKKQVNGGRNWVLRYKDHFRNPHAPTFLTKEAAIAEAEQLGLITQFHTAQRHLYDELDAKVVKEIKGSDLSIGTRLRKLTVLRYLREHLEGTELHAIDVPKISEVESRLAEDRSPRVTDEAMKQLERLMGAAAQLGWVRVNPFDLVPAKPLPPVPLWQVLTRQSDIHVLPSLEEVNIMLTIILNGEGDDEAGLLIALILLSGVRIGEALALQWDNLLFDDGEIDIRRSLSHFGEAEGKTKTPAGQRRTMMTPALARLFEAWQVHRGSPETGYVFLFGERTQSAYAEALRAVRAWLKQHLNGRHITFTSMRHACAALWIWMQMPDDAVSVWMGHASIPFTLDVYGYLFDLVEQGQPSWPTGPEEVE